MVIHLLLSRYAQVHRIVDWVNHQVGSCWNQLGVGSLGQSRIRVDVLRIVSADIVGCSAVLIVLGEVEGRGASIHASWESWNRLVQLGHVVVAIIIDPEVNYRRSCSNIVHYKCWDLKCAIYWCAPRYTMFCSLWIRNISIIFWIWNRESLFGIRNLAFNDD